MWGIIFQTIHKVKIKNPINAQNKGIGIVEVALNEMILIYMGGSRMKTIAIIGTFDTKPKEFLFLKDVIESHGLKTLMIDGGTFESKVDADITNTQVMSAAGENIDKISEKEDRGLATEILSRGMEKLLPRLYEEGRFDGVISLGGSGGTAIATAGMKALPIGVPKVMVSTLAGGSNVEAYVGTSDIMMFPSIVDVSGLNSISTKIFTNAANAVCGMVEYDADHHVEQKPLVAATMFGVTTPSVDFAREYLEERGYEVLVFHATGTGGRTMESLVEDGFFDGVLDMTTTELCDELFGGILAAGPDRLEAAGKAEVPQVVSLGALDMVNFGPRESVPKKYDGRNFNQHNPTITLMRTIEEENELLGKTIGEKLNRSKGPTTLMIPLKGLSAIDKESQPFYGPKEDEKLFVSLREAIDRDVVELVEMENNINDREFAEAAAQRLIDLMDGRK